MLPRVRGGRGSEPHRGSKRLWMVMNDTALLLHPSCRRIPHPVQVAHNPLFFSASSSPPITDIYFLSSEPPVPLRPSGHTMSNTAGESGQVAHKCWSCPRAFGSIPSRQRHFNTVHQGQGMPPMDGGDARVDGHSACFVSPIRNDGMARGDISCMHPVGYPSDRLRNVFDASIVSTHTMRVFLRQASQCPAWTPSGHSPTRLRATR